MTEGERREDGPLTPAEEARHRAYVEAATREHPPLKDGMFDMAARLFATLDAARAANPERRESHDGTETNCPIKGIHQHTFRGPHRFREWEPGT